MNISNDNFVNKYFVNNCFSSEKADIYLIFLNIEKIIQMEVFCN